MRKRRFTACLAAILAAGVLLPAPSRADGRCDLQDVIGFQVLFGKPIQGYVQNRIRKSGYNGCETDRVLVFTDNTGLRCKEVAIQSEEVLPNGYLFANAKGELKLCVKGQLFDVQTTN